MELKERERKIADALARAMAPHVDANEMGKVLSFWRRWRSPEKVFALLERLPGSGLVRSGRTREYYEAMNKAFRQYLKQNTRSETFGTILGWAFRLMRYYQLEGGNQHRRNKE